MLSEKDRQIQEAQEQIQILNSDIEMKEQAIRSREQEIDVKNATIAILEGEKLKFEDCVESLRKQHDEAMTAIEAIKTEKQHLQMRLESQIAKCGQILSHKDVQIAQKDKLNRELQERKKSTIMLSYFISRSDIFKRSCNKQRPLLQGRMRYRNYMKI